MSQLKAIEVFHHLTGRTHRVMPREQMLEYLPTELPIGWTPPNRDGNSPDGAYWTFVPKFGKRFKVLASAAIEGDNKMWLHLSLSKWNQGGDAYVTPDWADIKHIKQLFLPRREAYIVLPSMSNYVNLAEVYHLWTCLEEGRVLPDFTNGSGSI